MADSARNLARTLQCAPRTEDARHTALRHYLASAALRIAEGWHKESLSIDRDRSLAYHATVWKLRSLAVELSAAASVEPHGLRLALEAFSEHFLPNALLLLRPAGLVNIVLREHLRPLKERLSALEMLPSDRDTGVPAHVLAARYPQGEQDNVLMACTALPYFHQPRLSHVFATAHGGPAYFFAVASEIQNNKGFNDTIELPRLCFIGELLEISGWLEHAQVGPLIDRWRRHFGLGPEYLDEHVTNPAVLRSMREMQEAYRSRSEVYSPEDFDREAPAVWARLRHGTPYDAAAPERSSAVPRVITVMNAGWSFSQLYMDDFYAMTESRTPVERYEARQVLNALLVRSIQCAQID